MTKNLKPGEDLNIVSHSHGGNVVKDYSQIPGAPQVDTAINLGTPQRSEHIMNLERVGNYFNVYSIYDGVQDDFGGIDWETVINMDVGFAKQRSHWGINIELNQIVEQGRLKNVGHSDYYTLPAWRWIEFYVNQQRRPREEGTVDFKY